MTEDNWWRIITNYRVAKKNFDRSADELEEFSMEMYSKFADQFTHDPGARRWCPNQNCNTVYAYFFADWEFCPKCGTKLTKGEKDENIS